MEQLSPCTTPTKLSPKVLFWTAFHAQLKSCMQACSVMSNSFAIPWTIYSLPASSVHGISQARILEWVAISSSRGSYQIRDRTHISWVSCIGRWFLYLGSCASFFKTLDSPQIPWASPPSLDFPRTHLLTFVIAQFVSLVNFLVFCILSGI